MLKKKKDDREWEREEQLVDKVLIQSLARRKARQKKTAAPKHVTPPASGESVKEGKRKRREKRVADKRARFVILD